MTMKIGFYTLGCKVNQYDTQAMLECFEQNGYTVVHGNAPADVYVVAAFGQILSQEILAVKWPENTFSMLFIQVLRLMVLILPTHYLHLLQFVPNSLCQVCPFMPVQTLWLQDRHRLMIQGRNQLFR